MSPLPSRHHLEADLLRHQEAGDLAAQAETLIALAEYARYDDEAYRLAQGLYGQAWAIYEQLGDKRSIAQIVLALKSILPHIFWNGIDWVEENVIDLTHLYEMALALSIEVGDPRAIADLYADMGYSGLYTDERAAPFLEQAFELYTTLEDVTQQLEMLERLFYRYPSDTSAYWQTAERALAICRSQDDSKSELKFLHLIYRHRLESPEVQPYLERAFFLYRQLGDVRSEADLYVELGHAYNLEGAYEQARAALDAAFSLYNQIEAYDLALNTRHRLGAIILKTEGYEAYLQHHAAIYEQFRTRSFHKHALFRDLYQVAFNHNDFATARIGFQRTIADLWDIPEQQAEVYWDWGCMEADDLGNLHMGFMLCQRAVTLLDQCLPGQNRYHKRLRQMRRRVNPSRYKYGYTS